METRTIQLPLDVAKRWYKDGGELKEVALQAYKEEELKVIQPHSWEEFCENFPVKLDEVWIKEDSTFNIVAELYRSQQNRHNKTDRNLCTSLKEAEAFLALMQLRQLRKAWIGDWEANWNNYDSQKYCIIILKDEFVIGVYYQESRPLSFPTREMAQSFRHYFKDLMETARILL